MKSSSFSGFYKLPMDDRVREVQEFAGLSDEEASLLKGFMGLPRDTADRMIENVVGCMPLPLGIAVNFQVNGADRLVPMAIEEPSVVAAASHAAKLARATGGFTAKASPPLMIGQIQIVGVGEEDFNDKAAGILGAKKELLDFANSLDPVLVKFGGGARDIEVREVKTSGGRMMGVHLVVDVRDAMGANAVNTMCEALAPKIEELTGGTAILRIISNLAVKRTVRAGVKYKKEDLGGEGNVDRIVNAYYFAEGDPFRAATHNKGAMNGIDAVVIATGNDWRAIEAGVHAYAAMGGRYLPVTKWWKSAEGDLEGSIEVPMAVGLVGGATKTHPVAKVCVKILGVKTAAELAEIIACVGLAQNFAALKALATEGIQRGHMGLHARNVAVAAGATGELVDRVAAKMVEEKRVRADRAKELVEEMKGKQAPFPVN
ncbi:MAG: hydroxymethylglutaryl-CoA reductase, degradative [Candidatus ainarchaeum sp.]|nr:hydroxymethylglutaryl-CoA reductase, degradative [Candidatus ainarchaeum sp.]